MATKNTNLSFFASEDVPKCDSLSFGIVVSEWNESITSSLYKGAYDTLIECGVSIDNISTYNVPGSFELVFGAKIAAKKKPNAIICLGSIIKGETKHFDFVRNSVSLGL